MPLQIEMLIILIAGCSLAGFVDAAVGGGGIISLPIYMLTGFPPHPALGTNKLTSTFGTTSASINFFRHGKISLKLLMFYIPFTFVFSAIGVKTVLLVDTSFLKPIIMILTFAVGIYTLLSKKIGGENRLDINKVSKKQFTAGIIFSSLIGFYDGFFGPGTGSFLILAFIFVFKMDFLSASANAKILNLTSNISALIFFALEGKIYFAYGAVVILFVIPSAILGSTLAIKKGIRFIKPIFITMSLLVSMKILIDIISEHLYF